MDMKEPKHFESSMASNSAALLTGQPRLTVLFCLGLCSLAWLFLSYWSVRSVAYGIESAHLYPPSFGAFEINAFAVALQIISSLFGVVLPLLFARWQFILAIPLVLAVYLGVTVFEGYHGVLSQHKTSSAPALVNHELAELNSLSRRITEASSQLSGVYTAKRDAFNTIANDAAKGRDETGVAHCGDICKDNRRRYATATTRYSHLALQAAPAAAKLPADADLRLLLTDVKDRSEKLSGAKGDLIAFYRDLDKSAPPALLVSEIDAIARSVDEKAKTYQNLHSLNAFTLAMDQSNQAFAEVSAGKLPAPESRLPLVYGLLPSLAILVLSIMINASLKALGPGYQGVGHTAMAWLSESLQAKILPRLEALSAKNFIARIRIRTRSMLGKGEQE